MNTCKTLPFLIVLIILIGSIGFSCSSDDEGDIPDTLQVGDEVDPADKVSGFSHADVGEGKMVMDEHNGTVTIVWQEQGIQSVKRLMGARYRDGEGLDKTGVQIVPIALSAKLLLLVPHDGTYELYFTDFISQHHNVRRLVLDDKLTVLEDRVLFTLPKEGFKLLWTGRFYFLIYYEYSSEDSDSIYGYRFTPAGELMDTEPILLLNCGDNQLLQFDIDSMHDRFLLVFSQWTSLFDEVTLFGQLFDENCNSLTDTFPIVVKQQRICYPTLTKNNQSYLLVWASRQNDGNMGSPPNTLFGMTITTNGELGQPEPIVIDSFLPFDSYYLHNVHSLPRSSPFGDEFLCVYNSNEGTRYTLIREYPLEIEYHQVSVESEFYSFPHLLNTTGDFIRVIFQLSGRITWGMDSLYREKYILKTITHPPAYSSEQPVACPLNSTTSPVIAGSSSRELLLWTDDRRYIPNRLCVYARRLDSQGQFMDDQDIPLFIEDGNLTITGLARGKNTWMIGLKREYPASGGQRYYIYSDDLVLLAESPMPFGSYSLLAFTGDGERYALFNARHSSEYTYTFFLRLIEDDGTTYQDIGPFFQESINGEDGIDAAYLNDRYLLICYCENFINGYLFNRKGEHLKTFPIVKDSPFTGKYASVVAGENVFLVCWSERRKSKGYSPVLARRISTEGELLDSSPTVLSETSTINFCDYQRTPSVVWNGSTFLIVWQQQRMAAREIHNHLVASRLREDGTIIDPDWISLTDNDNADVFLTNDIATDITTTGNGAFIVTYHYWDCSSDYNTNRVRYRVLTEH